MDDLAAGQQWTYRTPAGFETSRLVIGAIVSFQDHEPVVCCAVTDAPRRHADGHYEPVTIPFLPLTKAAFRATVGAPDAVAEPPPGFAEALSTWRDDPRGLSIFTVPFEGSLDRMIALQMAAIIGHSAA